MNKKFLSAILFGALMVTSTGTFVSCKDYDDDIDNLQTQVDQKASLEKLTSLESDLAAAKNEAAAAKAAAEKAADAAEAARQEAKIAAIEAVEEKVASLTEEINATINASKAEVEEMAARIDTLVSEALGLIGNRLTSVALIPTTHINGIPAITVHTLKYTPQVYVKHEHEGVKYGDHTENPWLDHTAVLDEEKKPVAARFISSNDNEVKFHLNPSLGVRPQDILLPSFDCIVSENYDTRAVDAKLASNNSPIMPTPDQEINIEKGILTLKFQKSLLEQIGTEGDYDTDGGKEKFYMASLKVPVAEANWTEAEKEAYKNGTIDGVYVNSEYNRVEEIVRVPYLVNSKTFEEGTSKGLWNTAWFANEQMKDADGNLFFVHYHDSICLYNSVENQMVDVKWEYKKPLDLKTLVDVCTIAENESQHWNHEQLKNYKAYGLEFRFALAAEKYIQGANKTNEQEFAVIDSPVNGIMTSKVYEVGADGTSRAAIGREPIVRVSLIDTNNDNALVAQRYIKVRWTDAQVPAQEIAGVTFPDAYVSCKDMFQQLYTKDMNEKVYHLVKVTTDGGEATTSISKENFHNMYNAIKVVDLKKDGVSILKNVKAYTSINLANGYFCPGKDQVEVEGTEAIIVDNSLTEAERLDSAIVVFGFLRDDKSWNESNQSNNIVWAMSPKAVGELNKDARASKFEITVQYQDASGMHGAIQQTFTQNIVVPAQKFAYQGTYWKDGVGEGVFNVNPIVYNTNNDGKPSTTHTSGVTCDIADYSHIEADLINGYIYSATSKRPANLGEYIQYIRSCADVRFVFDESKFENFEHLAGYKVVNGVELWKVTTKTPTLKDEETGANHNIIGSDEYIFDYVQEIGAYKDSIAATINNFMGATPETNKNKKTTLEWNYDEPLGENVDQIQSVIRLHETDEENGTPAAIGLIGKNVPVKLLVAYNKYNVFSEQEFEVHFIDPLAISDGALNDSFVDAVIDGDFLSVAENFQFTDWNGYAVASATAAGATGKAAYAHELYDYYAVKNVVFATDKVTTSLSMEGNTYIHKDGVKDGKLPAKASLKQMNWDENTNKSSATEVSANPTHLAYFNFEGTPVNVDYQLFVDVQVQYKWGVLGKTGLPVWVKTAEGVKK